MAEELSDVTEVKDLKIDQNEQQINAIGSVYAAVKMLPQDAAIRVLEYVGGMIAPGFKMQNHIGLQSPSRLQADILDNNKESRQNTDIIATGGDNTSDGISSIGHKWMQRNGIDSENLSKVFSLGLDEIDLVAKQVPGKNIKEKMKNVFLLKGISAYLGTGAARFSQDQVREACQHYGAWDAGNSAKYIKDMAAELGGTSSSGYTLTARGITAATELVKTMIG